MSLSLIARSLDSSVHQRLQCICQESQVCSPSEQRGCSSAAGQGVPDIDEKERRTCRIRIGEKTGYSKSTEDRKETLLQGR